MKTRKFGSINKNFATVLNLLADKKDDSQNSESVVENKALMEFLSRFGKDNGGLKSYNLDLFVKLPVFYKFVQELRAFLMQFPEKNDGNKLHCILEGQYIRLDMGGFFLRRGIDSLPEDFSSDFSSDDFISDLELENEDELLFTDEMDDAEDVKSDIESSDEEPSEMPEDSVDALDADSDEN